MATVDLLVFGSGSLTRALITALATRRDVSLSVVIAARDEDAACSIAFLARAVAATRDNTISITPAPCDYSRNSLESLFTRFTPRIVLMLASLQSPWRMKPRWRQLIQALGYGFTLPLQASLADRVFGIAQVSHPKALLINGCYPDMVNGLLAARGISVLCGIGNVATLAALVRSMYSNQAVTLLGHHAHIAAFASGRCDGIEPPVVWINGARRERDEVFAFLNRMKLPSNDSINSVTGATAVPLLQALTGHLPSWVGHAPGVHGLPGGYPVRVDASGLTVCLPPDMTLTEARSINEDFGRHDGVCFENGTYRLTKTTRELEERFGLCVPECMLSWRAETLEEQVEGLETIRREIDDPQFETLIP